MFKKKSISNSIRFLDKIYKPGETTYTLSASEIKEKFGFAYYELSNKKLKKISKDCIKEESKPLNHFPKLCISKMDEKVGWGVFTMEDIPKGSIICTYTGESTTQNICNRRYSFISDIQFSKMLEEGKSSYDALRSIPTSELKVIDASKHGNVGRFIQHLPNHEELKRNYSFSADNQTIATENLFIGLYPYSGETYMFFTASKDIKAGNQLGCSYGPSYWITTQQSPALFNHAGQIIPNSMYKVINFNIVIKNQLGHNIIATEINNELLEKLINLNQYCMIVGNNGKNTRIAPATMREILATNQRVTLLNYASNSPAFFERKHNHSIEDADNSFKLGISTYRKALSGDSKQENVEKAKEHFLAAYSGYIETLSKKFDSLTSSINSFISQTDQGALNDKDKTILFKITKAALYLSNCCQVEKSLDQALQYAKLAFNLREKFFPYKSKELEFATTRYKNISDKMKTTEPDSTNTSPGNSV